ncbi:MAG: NAD kinase [Bacteroidota bacterium]|nr:MAG: NAD kinase [Bacteroidota bacterium]
MKIALFGKQYEPSFHQTICELLQRLQHNGVEISVYEPFYQFILQHDKGLNIPCSLFSRPEESPNEVDFFISIGGDGTFLESMLYLKSSTIPVIGLNSGRLGFLANISKDEISKALDCILNGEYKIEYRSLLRVESEMELFGGYNFALNEVTIQKNDSSLISIDAWLDDEFLNTYWTDGLIVATPTGSTAYSLSVGGPVVVPGSDNFIIAPIASHNLTVRPIVFHDSTLIRLNVKTRGNSFLVTVDNRIQKMTSDQASIIVRKSKFELQMLRLPFNNYYSTLRNKLMWGADKRNYAG